MSEQDLPKLSVEVLLLAQVVVDLVETVVQDAWHLAVQLLGLGDVLGLDQVDRRLLHDLGRKVVFDKVADRVAVQPVSVADAEQMQA